MAVHFDEDDLRRLLGELERLRERYGGGPDIQHELPLRSSIARRRKRIEIIRRHIDELAEEAATLERELVGYRAGLVAHLTHLVDRLRHDHAEGWSPTPVMGYRMWALLHDRVEGVRRVWPTSRLRATCGAGYDDVEIPHTDGRCGRLGCGVYAAKRPEPVLESFRPASGHRYVAGRVAMTGKVVEHDTGYRAEVAEAVAVVAAGRHGVLATRDPALIDALFRDPHVTMSSHDELVAPSHWTDHMTIAYLTEIEEEPWTSASNAG